MTTTLTSAGKDKNRLLARFVADWTNALSVFGPNSAYGVFLMTEVFGEASCVHLIADFIQIAECFRILNATINR